jgi:DNA-directed RNA polymerase III subunit RPC6
MAPPAPATRKRPATDAKAAAGAKKARAASNPIKIESGGNDVVGSGTSIRVGASSAPTTETPTEVLKARFINVFTEPIFKVGISNAALKDKFGEVYIQLVPIINELVSESRLVMSKLSNGGLFYAMVSDEIASKFAGLDVTARMVYQVIERAGNMGIWTKDIRIQTNVDQQALNKIFKGLESRRLIKPVKSVTAKAKKLYMLYNLTPSKELTGGVWYSDLEFDHEFISELRTFLLHCVRRLNGGRGVTL